MDAQALLAKLLMNYTPLGGVAKIEQLRSIPAQASNQAEQIIPGQAWNETQFNALRHSLGAAEVAQALGATQGGIRGTLAGLATKGLGYGWESLDGFGLMDGEARDTKHDLNNNAVGIQMAQQIGNQGGSPADQQAAVIQALTKAALASRLQDPPGFFQPSVGYLTRSK